MSTPPKEYTGKIAKFIRFQKLSAEEWISVQEDLPHDGQKVLVLVKGFFPDENALRQKHSHRIFEGEFNRRTGWKVNFCPPPYWIIYWMDRPSDPVLE